MDDDIAEGNHVDSLIHSSTSSDSNYNGIPVSDLLTFITDNDNAEVVISKTTANVTEGNSNDDSYTVKLISKPRADVTITLSTDTQVSGVPTGLTFTPVNWNTPQTVNITAVDDSVDEDGHTGTITHSASSSDNVYNSITINSVTANITDNDTAGVTITESSSSTDISEDGSTDTYTVVLNTQPTSDVTITVDPDVQLDLGSGQGASTNLTFTTANWNVPQTITVNAIDDQISESILPATHTGVITHSATSMDVKYNGGTPVISSVSANITDNDSAGVIITESSSSTDIAEGGATDTYTVVLNTQPTSDVTITLSSDSQVSSDKATITFTSLDWNSPQTITVNAVDDLVDEDGHTGVISHSASSSDGNYDGIGISSVTSNITDNDTAGIIVTEISGTTNVTEGGITDTFTLVLGTQPTADVTISVSPDSQVSVDKTSLTFTSANWNTPQTVTVTAVDDNSVELSHTGNINNSASSSDGKYDGIAVANVPVIITDNDTAGVTITEAGGTNVTEGGATDTFTVVLNTLPADDVTISISPDTQVSVDKTSITFTAGNWNSPQTITVTAVDDDVDEDSHSGVITHSASSSDGNYDGLGINNVSATITDNDTAGVTITEAGGTNVIESGATDTYTVVLDTKPSSDVTISVSPDAQVSLDKTSLTFTSDNWDTAQTITVTAVDDSVDEGNHTGTITHIITGGDSKYTGSLSINSVTANITDNDTAGVTITESSSFTAVTEGGATDTYTIVLNTEPVADVTITLSPDAQVSLDKTSITFTAANWNTAQTITITAVNDLVDENSHVGITTHSAASTDGKYDGISVSNLSATITDNDTAGVTITESGGTTDTVEGGATDSFTVVLNTQPTADVTIAVDPDTELNLGSGQGTAVNLTFTTANWNTPQIITAAAYDDFIIEGVHTGAISNSATSTDGKYNGISITGVTVNIADNDTANVIITEVSGTNVTEGGSTDTYDVRLATQPSADVTITLSPDAQVSLDKASLTFTSANWNSDQTVTVTAVDDAAIEGAHSGTITHSSSSGDSNYNGLSVNSVTASIIDDDAPGVVITESSGSTAITEGGATDSYNVTLTASPSNNVTVTVDPDVQLDIGNGQGGFINLTFTSANWNVPQTITVTAVDDSVDEGTHNSSITHSSSSSDGNFNGLTINGVTASITDNDSAGVTITESSSSTDVTEGTGNDTYTVVLTSEPTADVTVNLSPDAQVSLDKTSLTFTSANWSSAQTITVTAVDDSVDEDAHTGAITHSSTSTDGNYEALTINSVTANVTDNDTAGVTITEAGGTAVTEGTGNDTYTVVLDTKPTADVTITLVADTEVTLDKTTLTFTSANWDTAQTITITAVDDLIAEGNHSGVVTHSASSTDGKYSGISISSVTAAITDNDTAGVTITETGGTAVTEGGATDTYTVVLTSQPTANVTITLTPDAQVSLNKASLIFTAANWDQTQSVTVTAINDLVAEGSHSGVVTHSSSSTDGNYTGALSISSVTATITDNDTAGVTITESGGTAVTEGGSNDTYTIVLTSEPTADVTITFDPDVQLDVGSGQGAADTFTFTSANWNIPQTVTVDAFDDSVDEDSHTGVITHSASSTDGNYTGALSINSVTATISDNDTAAVSVIEADGNTAVTEGTGNDTYTVVLLTQPTADVTITLTPDAQVSLDKASLTFTSVNWNTAQTVTVTAVNDSIAEGNHTGAITHSASSSDGKFDGITVSGVTAAITDNDTAGVTITETGGTAVTEDGASDTYTVVLTSEPTADVTITVDPDSQLDIGNGQGATDTLTFTSANWNSAQTVTVNAFNDTTEENSPHTGVVTHSAASGDANYNSISITNVSADITDNDGAVPVITSAETIDSDNDGQIDHYRITFDESVNDSTVPGYNAGSETGNAQTAWLVNGYSNAVFVRGAAAPETDYSNDNIIYLKFDESGSSDTGSKPDLTTTASPGVEDMFGKTMAQRFTAEVEADRALPVLISATGTSNTSVTVVFSETMEAGSLECSTGGCSSIYTIGGLTVDSAEMAGGAGVDGDTVVLTTSSQTIGTDNYTLTATAGQGKDLANNGVNSSMNSDTFSGQPPAVKLVSATAVNNTTVELTFNVTVTSASAQGTPSNYTIAGLTVSGANMYPTPGTDSATVRLTTSSHSSNTVDGYTVTVTSNVITAANGGNKCLSPDNTATFTGDTLPEVVSATSVDSTTVDIVFSEAVQWDTNTNGALLYTNYSINNGLSVSAANAQTPQTTVRLTTSAQSGGENYIVTVSNIKDSAGNSIGAANTANFTGLENIKILSGAKLFGHDNIFYITFSKPVMTGGGNNAADNINNWSFPSGLTTGGAVSFCTSSDTLDCPDATGTPAGVSSDGKTVYFKTVTAPDNGSYTVVGATDGGGFGSGCILPSGGTATDDCLQPNPNDRASVAFDPPTNAGDGPVYDDPFNDTQTLSGQVIRYNGKLLIGPNYDDSGLFQTDINLTNSTSITLDADPSTAGEQAFDSTGTGGKADGIDYMYAACDGASSGDTTLSGTDCTSQGGTEYLFIVGYLTGTAGYRDAWISNSTNSPFSFTNVTNLSYYSNKTFRAMTVRLFKGWVYQAMQHQWGQYAIRASKYQPDGTVYSGGGSYPTDLGWRYITRLGAMGTQKNGQWDAMWNNNGTGYNGLISVDYMFEYSNDGGESRLYLANGGSCDASDLTAQTRTGDSDGGIVRTTATYSTAANPLVQCTGTANCNAQFEDVTPTSTTWNRFMSKALPQEADAGYDWDYLQPANTIIPAVKAIPVMTKFNGDLYIIRNACSSTNVQSLSTTVHDTCPSGSERPQLWRLPANCGDASSCQSAWQFIGDATSFTTRMSGATWTGGSDQATKTGNNKHITLLVKNGSRLYIGFDNHVNGLNVWRTKDGITTPSSEADFEAICMTGNTCTDASKQFGWGSTNDNTKIFDGISVNDAGTDYVIFSTRTGTSPMHIYRTGND